MSTPTIGASIKLQGEKEFRQALSDINAGLKVHKSEMNMLIAQYSKNASSTEALAKKGEALENQILSQTDKIEMLENALKSSANEYGEGNKKTMQWQASLNEARTELIKMDSALQENKRALEASKESLTENEQAVSDAKNETSDFGDTSSSIFKKFGIDISGASGTAGQALASIIDGFKNTSGVADQQSGIIGKVLEAAPVAGAGAVVAAIFEICSAAQEAANEIEWASDKMQVALGLTEEEAEKAAKSVQKIYNTGLADSKEEAQDALTATTRLLGLQGKEAELASNKVLTISKAFGEDVNSTTRTASTLMKTFGISANEAFDIMTTGLQSSANKNGDLLDVLNEYSVSFERIGYDANEFLTMITSATDAGAYSADKSADVVKEFYNKAASGSADFSEALKSLGLNSKQTINQITAGGDTAKMAFEKVATKLSNVTNESKQAQIASKLFGSQWEDVGTEATLALSKTEDKLIDTTGAANKAFETLATSSKTAQESASRNMEGAGKKALDVGLELVFPSIMGIIRGMDKLFVESSKSTNKKLVEDAKEAEKAGEQTGDNFAKGLENKKSKILGTADDITKSTNRILGSAGSSNSGSKIPKYALGTSYHRGGFARVNDKLGSSNSGEIIDLPTGSRVYPAGMHPTGGDTYNITIDAKNVKEFNDIVKMAQEARQMRRAR